MFHIPAHKNTTHPAGQVREPHGNGNDPANPDRPTDYPTAPREPKPRACTVGEGGTDYGTCFAGVLRARIEERNADGSSLGVDDGELSALARNGDELAYWKLMGH